MNNQTRVRSTVLLVAGLSFAPAMIIAHINAPKNYEPVSVESAQHLSFYKFHDVETPIIQKVALPPIVIKSNSSKIAAPKHDLNATMMAWDCGIARDLVQGSGTVRTCEWKK